MSAMRKRAARDGGFTMVEVLVVVAIIAIMAGIAVPAFTRMGLFGGDVLQNSARELYTMLQAARIYAITYNVETAVCYATAGGSASLRAVAVMYGYRNPDIAQAYGLENNPQIFTPVAREDLGPFRLLPGETCLLECPGCEHVYVPPELAYPDKQLLAHVFEASGRLRKPDYERYTVQLGMTPESDPSDLYTDLETMALRTRTINLYRATGRVEVVND